MILKWWCDVARLTDENMMIGKGHLTGREHDVLSRLLADSSNKEIARSLNLSKVKIKHQLTANKITPSQILGEICNEPAWLKAAINEDEAIRLDGLAPIRLPKWVWSLLVTAILPILDKIINHRRIGQGWCIAELIIFIGGNFPQNAPHDLAWPRFWQLWCPLQ